MTAKKRIDEPLFSPGEFSAMLNAYALNVQVRMMLDHLEKVSSDPESPLRPAMLKRCRNARAFLKAASTCLGKVGHSDAASTS